MPVVPVRGGSCWAAEAEVRRGGAGFVEGMRLSSSISFLSAGPILLESAWAAFAWFWNS